MSTRAVLYLRQSLDRTGEGLAVERQREDAEKLCHDRGWTIVAEYIDNSLSASKKTVQRPEYDRMVADYEADRFEALVCYDLDRLTRQPRQLEDWIDAAEERGLRLVTTNGEADLSTDGGRLFARIKASVAKSEVERKSARQKRAGRQRAESGRPAGRSYGYTEDGSAIVPAEAAVVREMYSRLLAGDSIVGISRWLEGDEVPGPTGGGWHRVTIRRLLMRPTNAGIASYHGSEVGAGTWPAIVDEATLRAAIAILRDPKRMNNRVGTPRKYLGSGLFLCGLCGTPVAITGGPHPAYRCPTAEVNRTVARVDEVVVGVITERLRQPDIAGLLVRDAADRAEPLRTEAGTLRLRLEQMTDDYAAGLLDGVQLHRASDKVHVRLAEVEKALADLGRAAGLGPVLAAADPAAAFLAAPLGVRRAVVDALATVTLDRGVRGHAFDPTTVRIAWKGGES